MDFEKILQGYLYDCVEPFNHWLPWIWLDEGHLMLSNIYIYKESERNRIYIYPANENMF